MIKQHKDLKQLYGNISLHSTFNDAQKQKNAHLTIAAWRYVDLEVKS